MAMLSGHRTHSADDDEMPALFGGLGANEKPITNAWGFEVNQADILAAFNEMDPRSTNRIVYSQFSSQVEKYKLNWDKETSKRVWSELDDQKKKFLDLQTFSQGLRSTNSNIQEFYRLLMGAIEFDPEKTPDFGDAPSKPSERLRWLRNFAKKARNFDKLDNDNDTDWRDVCEEIRLICRCITKNGFIASEKKYSAFSMWCQFGKNYLSSVRGLIARDMCIFYARVAQHAPEAFYKTPAKVFQALSYWLNVKGSYSTEYAFDTLKVALLCAPSGNKSVSVIINGCADIILKEYKQMTATWLQKWLTLVIMWMDSHDIRNFDDAVWTKIAKICETGVHNKDENVRHDGLQMLSRIDVYSHEKARIIEKSLTSQTRKRYKRDYGPTKIVKYTKDSKLASPTQSTPGLTLRAGDSNRSGGRGTTPRKVRQKAVIGALGAQYTKDKVQKSGKMSGKQRIADITLYDELLNPYEMPISKIDIELAFRYADVNQDGTISQKDFVLSLRLLGIEKTDVVAKELFTYLSPKLRPLKLGDFEKKLKLYNEDFQPFFCRLISCNHLLRQPFSQDKPIKDLKKVLKDTRKLIWKQKIEAMYALCRGLARHFTSDQFKIKFKPMCKYWCAALKDVHPMVSRAASVALTKMTWYQKGGFTKYLKPILETCVENFKKENKPINESTFGLCANIIKHVPDTKTYVQLQTLKTMVGSKNLNLQKYGWKLLNVQLERIVGLSKKRPDGWWKILDECLLSGTKIKKESIAEFALISFIILESSQYKKQSVYKYKKSYPQVSPAKEQQIRAEYSQEVQKNIDEYRKEAKAAEANLDMYSLLSDTTDEEKAEAGSEKESIGTIGAYDDLPLVLHAISPILVQQTYDTFDIKTNFEQLDVVNAALKYLGVNVQRGELTLLMGEVNSCVQLNELWSVEIFSLLVRHAYGTLEESWGHYYESVTIATDILEAEILAAETANVMNPTQYINDKILLLKKIQNTNKSEDTFEKCNIIQSLYAAFAAPEVENDAILFEQLMEAVNPIFLNELKSGNISIVIQEVCICLSRIVQYHVSRFENFGTPYYECLFKLMSSGSSITFHSCSQTAFIIGKLVDFLSEDASISMTKKLIECIDFAPNNIKYEISIIKTIVASVITNTPVQKNETDSEESILKMWNLCKFIIYNGLNNLNRDIQNYCVNCIAYLYQIEYINFKENDNKESLNISKEILQAIEDVTNNTSWESLFDVTIEIDDTILNDYGWGDISKNELNDRKLLLQTWHELEIKSSNAIGMATVMTLIKTINRALKDNNRVQTRDVQGLSSTAFGGLANAQNNNGQISGGLTANALAQFSAQDSNGSGRNSLSMGGGDAIGATLTLENLNAFTAEQNVESDDQKSV